MSAWVFSPSYFVVGVVSACLVFAMAFSFFRNEFKSLDDARQDAGMCVLFAAPTVLIWPLLLPMIFCLTGFAKHGMRGRK